jgi:hypothetical protein
MNYEHEVLAWEAPEYHHWDKSPDWYWSVGIISASIVILCIMFGNLLFALFILLAATTGAIYASREPNVAHVELSRRGISVEGYLYTYDGLESFWIEEHGPHPKILIKSHKIILPFIVVPLGELHHEDARTYLLQYLKEVEHHESFGHKLLEYFGF